MPRWPRSNRPTRTCSRGSRDGDRDAFGDLYTRYARPVLGLALRRLGDRGRAEDATQETFASVWRAAAHATAPSAARSRRGSTPSRATQSPTVAARESSRRPSPPDTPSDEPGPPEQPSSRGSPGACTARSRRCPSPSASVLELAYWRGLSQSEIAELAGRPARHRQDANALRAAPAGRRAWRRADDDRPPRFPRARRRRGHARGAGGAPPRPRPAGGRRPAAGALAARWPSAPRTRERRCPGCTSGGTGSRSASPTAVAAAAFGVGYLVGDHGTTELLGRAARRDARRRPAGRRACAPSPSATTTSVGNYPLQMTLRGPPAAAERRLVRAAALEARAADAVLRHVHGRRTDGRRCALRAVRPDRLPEASTAGSSPCTRPGRRRPAVVMST